ARAEAARDENAVDLLELGLRFLERHPLRVEPAHVDGASLVHARVPERLVHREVGVTELDVLADERDLDLVVAARPDALAELKPLAQVGLAGGQAELLADQRIEALLLQR